MDLRDANLSRTNLTGADLREVRLEDAILTDATLVLANLDGASMFGADLTDVDATGASFQAVEGLTVDQLTKAKKLQQIRLDSDLESKLTATESSLLGFGKLETAPISLTRGLDLDASATAELKRLLGALDRGVEVFKEDAQIWRTRARTNFRLLEFAKAAKDFDQAFSLDPSNIKNLLMKATSQAYSGSQSGALQTIEQGLKISSSEREIADWHLARSIAYLMVNDEGGVRKAIEAAENLVPDNSYFMAGVRENLGLVYIRQGEWRKAYELSNEVLELRPSLSWSWLMRAISAERLGQEKEEDAALKQWHKFKKNYDLGILILMIPKALKDYTEKQDERGLKL